MRSTTRANVPVYHCTGFQIGTGFLKIGSIVPKAIARSTKKGTRNRTVSQATPGAANSGQNHRGYQIPSPRGRRFSVRVGGSATGLELGPDVVPGGVDGRAELELPGSRLPDRFVDHRGLQGRGDQLLLHQEIGRHGRLRRLVSDPADVLPRVVEVEHGVQ